MLYNPLVDNFKNLSLFALKNWFLACSSSPLISKRDMNYAIFFSRPRLSYSKEFVRFFKSKCFLSWMVMRVRCKSDIELRTSKWSARAEWSRNDSVYKYLCFIFTFYILFKCFLSFSGTPTCSKDLKIFILMSESCSFSPSVTTCLPELTGEKFIINRCYYLTWGF